MFSLTKQGKRMVKSALRFNYSDSRRMKWWLRDESLIPVAQSVLSGIDEQNESVSQHNVEILKQGDRRLILRIKPLRFNEKSFIIKVFRLRCLRHRLKYHRRKYHRYGFAEAANLIIASSRGLNVPTVYGYGRIYGPCRLIKMDIIIIQDLVHYTQLYESLKLIKGDEEESAKIFDRTIPIFVNLYEAGCNNIDMNLGAIMLGNEDSKNYGFVLDFEFAKFHDKPSLEILMFEAAHFMKGRYNRLEKETINNWIAKLLDAVKIRDNYNRERAIERFNYYLGTYLSRKERLRIC